VLVDTAGFIHVSTVSTALGSISGPTGLRGCGAFGPSGAQRWYPRTLVTVRSIYRPRRAGIPTPRQAK
jgi:hypothetical protein